MPESTKSILHARTIVKLDFQNVSLISSITQNHTYKIRQTKTKKSQHYPTAGG